jgi:hypothetical protein
VSFVATLGAPSAEVAIPAPANLAKSVDSAQPPANAPQLAKTAALSLQVTDAETSSQQAVSWARQAGGEVLGLEDSGATGEVLSPSPAPGLSDACQKTQGKHYLIAHASDPPHFSVIPRYKQFL